MILRTNGGSFIDIGGNDTNTISENTQNGGLINITGNQLKVIGDPGFQKQAVRIYNRGYLGNDIDITFEGNSLELGTGDPISRGINSMVVISPIGFDDLLAFRDIHITSNKGIGGVSINASSGQFSAKNVYVEGNNLKNGSECVVRNAENLVSFKNNTLFYCNYFNY